MGEDASGGKKSTGWFWTREKNAKRDEPGAHEVDVEDTKQALKDQESWLPWDDYVALAELVIASRS